MSRDARRKAAQAKEAKQKKIVIGGLVVLLAVVGYQAPKLLHHKSGATGATGTTSSVAGPDASALPATPARLVDAGPPQASAGQLVSFQLFKAKDPFVQQVSDSTGETSTTPAPVAAPPATTTPAPAPVPSVPEQTVPPATQTTPTETTPTTPPPTVPPATTPTAPTTTQAPPPTEPTVPVVTQPVTPPPPTTPTTPPPTVPPATAPTTPTATTPTTPTTTTPAPTVTAPPPEAPANVGIATNGACETLSVHDLFPQDTPLFELVSIARDGKSVEIGIAGGSLETGQPTVTLTMGLPLTLVNTADGVRYRLDLLSSCPTTTTTTPTTTTPTSPAPPTTTSTDTTPTDTTSTTPVASDQGAVNIRAIVPSIEAYYADNGTYVGITPEGLQSTYDQTLDPTQYRIPPADLSATSYCVQSPTTGTTTYEKVGPAGDVVPGSCP